MPGIVDPRPAWKAELAARQAELEHTTDEDQRAKLTAEIRALEDSLGHGHFFRKLLLGWRSGGAPW